MVEIRCTAWDLGQRPVADRGADRGHIHLEEEVAKGRIRGRALELDAQRLGQHSMVPARKMLQIPQALALAQDPEHRHQQQVPGWNPDALAHTGIRDRLEEADQIKIGCSGCDFGHGAGMTAAIEPDDNSPARALITYFESAPPAAPGLIPLSYTTGWDAAQRLVQGFPVVLGEGLQIAGAPAAAAHPEHRDEQQVTLGAALHGCSGHRGRP